jgi:hypothetical protein
MNDPQLDEHGRTAAEAAEDAAFNAEMAEDDRDSEVSDSGVDSERDDGPRGEDSDAGDDDRREEDSDASDDARGPSYGEGSKRQRAQTVRYAPEVATSVGGLTGGQRKRKKRKKGGFTNKATREQRSQRVAGTTRSCLPDAVWALAPDTLKEHGLTHGALLACMPPDGDTTVAAAGAALQPFGYTLSSASERYNAKGGPELALLQETDGRFLVQLTITYDNDDHEPDLHCVAFDGQTVRDNTKAARSFIALDDGDRATPAAARAVFNSLYPGLKVVVTSVYELEATCLGAGQVLLAARTKQTARIQPASSRTVPS